MQPTEGTKPAEAGACGKKRILLVDAHAANRQSSALLLCDSGYAVDWARSLVEARSRWIPGRYDLVLIDTASDSYDAVLLSQEIREISPGQMVAFLENELLVIPARFQPNGVIPKTGTPQKLLGAIKVLLADVA
jgi:DNA-binding response OmpR family regulator